jgi:hypothetical protein
MLGVAFGAGPLRLHSSVVSRRGLAWIPQPSVRQRQPRPVLLSLSGLRLDRASRVRRVGCGEGRANVCHCRGSARMSVLAITNGDSSPGTGTVGPRLLTLQGVKANDWREKTSAGPGPRRLMIRPEHITADKRRRLSAASCGRLLRPRFETLGVEDVCLQSQCGSGPYNPNMITRRRSAR